MAGVRVGPAASVRPGSLRAFDVAGTDVCIANAGGRFYAIGDTCTHRGCSLADGDLDGTILQCACHGSRFDVTTGAVVRGPAERPEPSYRVTVDGTDLFVET